MKLQIGDAVSVSSPENFKVILDDRQELVRTYNGSIVEDMGHNPAGARITCSAMFSRAEFIKIWDYFNRRTMVDVRDNSGIIWESMRVRIISYGYEPRFESNVNCELEFWRV